MYLMCVSLNYHHLTIDQRERFSFDAKEVALADQKLNQEKSILENVILATCNRTEVYAVVDQIHTGRYYIKRFLAGWFKTTPEYFNDLVTIFTREAAVKHLMEVATGLDSKLKGEPQILGQVKNAYSTAFDAGATGVLFNELFKQAITFAKRMHTEYRVSELSQSSGQAGLHQIKINLGTVKAKKLGVVGVGMMGSHTVANASTMGFTKVYVFNRTFEKAERLAHQYDSVVEAYPLDQLSQMLSELDAVIFATRVKKPLLKIDATNAFGRLEVIDLGVPRNVNYVSTEGINYYDIDDLNSVVSRNETERTEMLTQMASHVDAQVANYFKWEKQLHITPVIRGLREHALEIEGTAYDSLLRKLPDLDRHERKVISKHMKSIVNQMLRSPIKEIKELSIQENAQVDIDLFCQLFGLKDLKVGEKKNAE
ncbi:glutamyl-tRNA reductase [Lactobacillus sp. 3B(2020)]|uniref:glutamyl-tRNA reductase n=1 Tax=Lactobacillus sp. 3B(2020) TaxID=2695882 RepID=UPI0015DDFA2A|nr:glutamyl-tRNA reductase [Lactobacillus sp. 3B(2020)]QLL69185.1 glutamyl-tRNA reductase [Lactobacillus sp. 3B(2020)]